MNYVIDTSVLVRSLLNNPIKPKVEKILQKAIYGEIGLLAPQLIVYETHSALLKI